MIAAISLFVFLILALISVVSVFVIPFYLLKHKEEYDNKGYFRFFLKLYAYLMISVSLLMTAFGLHKAALSALSLVFDYPFSYSVYERIDPYSKLEDGTSVYKTDTLVSGERVEVFEGREYVIKTEQAANDLIVGATFIATSLVILLVHIGIVKNVKEKTDVLYKAFIITNLGIYGLVSLIILPVSVYQILSFALLNHDLGDYARPIPGEPISIMLAVLPIWLTLMYKARSIYIKKQND